MASATESKLTCVRCDYKLTWIRGQQAAELATRFQDHAPGATNLRTADSLRRVRQAFLNRAEAEKSLMAAVEVARDDRQSWAALGAMLGTSGEAARQRYGTSAVKR